MEISKEKGKKWDLKRKPTLQWTEQNVSNAGDAKMYAPAW
jgi:hypothetical protein